MSSVGETSPATSPESTGSGSGSGSGAGSGAQRWGTPVVTMALALTGALALWSAVTPWQSLTTATERMSAPLLCALLVALVSGLLRLVGLNSWVSVPVAAVAGLTVPLSVSGAGLLPTPRALQILVGELRETAAAIQQYSVPFPAEGGDLTLLITSIVLVLALVVDVALVRRGWASLVGFVLLLLHVLPSYFGGPAPWHEFALTALLFVLVLALLHLRASAPWESSPASSPPSQSRPRWITGNGMHVALAGGLAVGLATVTTTFLPLQERPWWQGGASGGSGDEVTIANPLLDLRRDLTRGADIDLLTVRGDGPTPTYLRTAVLREYDGEQWRTGDRRASRDDRATGDLPPLPGLSPAVATNEHTWTFTANQRFRSRWLPLPTQVSAVNAEGDWRIDDTTRDAVAWDPDLDTGGIEWTATEISPRLDAELLTSATRATPPGGAAWTKIPRTLPTIVSQLARDVTAQASTQFEQATLLQKWFRSEFEYSLETVERVGDDDLEAFLSPGGRVGYCEQFAASMALMARTLDIPARVAVGFLAPESGPDGTHVFSAHDLHAWPELYFEGAGWVRFEPTPGDRANNVPEYTSEEIDRNEPSPSASPSPSATPSAPSSTPRPSTAPRPEEPTQRENKEASTPWLRLVGIGAGILLSLALLLLPRLVRARRRVARLESADPELWWREVKESARDLGVLLPAGLSPRQEAATLQESDLVLDKEALQRVVEAVENVRYGPKSSTPHGDLHGTVGDVIAQMPTDLPAVRRFTAEWMPASLLRR